MPTQSGRGQPVMLGLLPVVTPWVDWNAQ